MTQCLVLITGSNFQCSFDLMEVQRFTINISRDTQLHRQCLELFTGCYNVKMERDYFVP